MTRILRMAKIKTRRLSAGFNLLVVSCGYFCGFDVPELFFGASGVIWALVASL
jgi:hypothetical protein